MRDDIESRLPLVVGSSDKPWRPRGVGRLEHVVTCSRVIIPSRIRIQIHLGQLPDLSLVVDPRGEPISLLLRTYLEPVLEKYNPRFDYGLFDVRDHSQETLGLILRAKAHTPFDPGAIVPTAVENHDLAPGRKMRQVSLNIHLRFLAFRRGGHGNDAENARADSCGHGLDDTTFAGAISSLEDHAYLLALALHPFLKLDELNVQLAQLLLVFLALEPRNVGILALAILVGYLVHVSVSLTSCQRFASSWILCRR